MYCKPVYKYTNGRARTGYSIQYSNCIAPAAPARSQPSSHAHAQLQHSHILIACSPTLHLAPCSLLVASVLCQRSSHLPPKHISPVSSGLSTTHHLRAEIPSDCLRTLHRTRAYVRASPSHHSGCRPVRRSPHTADARNCCRVRRFRPSRPLPSRLGFELGKRAPPLLRVAPSESLIRRRPALAWRRA